MCILRPSLQPNCSMACLNTASRALPSASSAVHEYGDPSHRLGLLSECSKRPCCGNTADKTDELAPPHGCPLKHVTVAIRAGTLEGVKLEAADVRFGS